MTGTANEARIYEFGAFRLDAARRQLLTIGGSQVELPSRAFDLLLYMVERAGELLDKSTLLKGVWPMTVVEESNLSQCIFALRRALGDTTQEHRFIVTVPGRGYQFVAQVQAAPLTPAVGQSAPSAPAVNLPAPPANLAAAGVSRVGAGKWRYLAAGAIALTVLSCTYLFWPRAAPQAPIVEPAPNIAAEASIAVLPFADWSPARDMEYFADGIAEEIMGSLAKVGGLRVIGRRSAFSFKGKNDDAQTIGEKLRVQTILEGSVRKDGDRIRISTQLTRTTDGVSLWTQTYDRKLDDVLDIQGAIAREVVAALAPVVHKPHESRTSGAFDEHPTSNADAYRAYLRGVYLYGRATDVDWQHAREEFLHAVELDPRFAKAYVWLARSYDVAAVRAIGNVAENRSLAAASLDKALKLDPAIADIWWVRDEFIEGDNAPFAARASGLERVIASSPDDTQAIHALAFVYLLQARRHEALQMFERAYAVDPLWVPAIGHVADVGYVFGGERQRALVLADEMENLAPQDSRASLLRAKIAFSEGRALDWDHWKAKAIAADPGNQPVHGYLSLDYGHLGVLDAAMYHAKICTVLNPKSAAGLFNVAHIHLFSGDIAAARPAVQQAMAQMPEDFLALLAQGELQYFTGDCAGAIQSLSLAHPGRSRPEGSLDLLGGPEHVAILVWCLRRQGNAARVAEMSRVFDAQYGPPVTAGNFEGWRARMAAATGDRDKLVMNLAALARTKSMAWAFSADEPMIQPYLHDPEVKALLDVLDARRAEWRKILPKSSMRVPVPGVTAADIAAIPH